MSRRRKPNQRVPARARAQARSAPHGAPPTGPEIIPSTAQSEANSAPALPTRSGQESDGAQVPIEQFAIQGSLQALTSLRKADRPVGLGMILIAAVPLVLSTAAITQVSLEMGIIVGALGLAMILALWALARGRSTRTPNSSPVRLEVTVTLPNGAPARDFTVTVHGHATSVKTSSVGYFALDVPKSVAHWGMVGLSIESTEGEWHELERSMVDLPWRIRIPGTSSDKDDGAGRVRPASRETS